MPWPRIQMGYIGRGISVILAIACAIGTLFTVISMIVYSAWSVSPLLPLVLLGVFFGFGFERNERIATTPHPLPRGWLARQLAEMPRQLPLKALMVTDAQRGGYDERERV